MRPYFSALPRAVIAATLLVSCSGGGGGDSEGGGDTRGGSTAADFDCDGACPHQNLSAAEVQLTIANAVAAAQSQGRAATIAVVDRVGNVLGVYAMDGAPPLTHIDSQTGSTGGLEGLTVPSALAAISKAGTGAYLSSQGNAFSTRTANQIIQEHYLPGERNQPGGPLFGVQFSQLPCGDVVTRNPDISDGRPSAKSSAPGSIGPRPLPLGLSADPGGLPLYKSGDLVGGIGIEFDGIYTIDREIRDQDTAPEELVALSASLGFAAPSARTAPNMNVGGRALRFTDIGYSDLPPTIERIPTLDEQRFLSIPEYSDGTVRAGATFGSVASGVAADLRAGIPAMTLVTAAGTNRYPTRSGASLGGAELTASEVNALLDSTLHTAFRARAAIRRPLDTAARVSIWVVDHQGTPLGFTRSEDAPVFGIDVALQKARTAAFFSSSDAATTLNSLGFQETTARVQTLLGPDALSNGRAFTSRAVGNLARPLLADGIDGTPPGPLSRAIPGTPFASSASESWSPFSTGLQLDLAIHGLAQSLGLAASTEFPASCVGTRRLANGLQIFPGSVPLYRGSTLIGAIGVSGDGIDQDSLVAFYGASKPGLVAAGHPDLGDPMLGFNAPREIRSDQIEFSSPEVGTLRLRYASCPEAPFRGENLQNVCEDL